MSKLPEISSPVSAKPSVSSTQGLTTLAEQSSMGLTTLVAPLQEAVTDKLFSGSLESGSVETTPETFADKLVRAAAHRAEIISQRREAARRTHCCCRGCPWPSRRSRPPSCAAAALRAYDHLAQVSKLAGHDSSSLLPLECLTSTSYNHLHTGDRVRRDSALRAAHGSSDECCDGRN